MTRIVITLRVRTRWWLLDPILWGLAFCTVAGLITEDRSTQIAVAARRRLTIITIEPDDTLSA